MRLVVYVSIVKHALDGILIDEDCMSILLAKNIARIFGLDSMTDLVTSGHHAFCVLVIPRDRPRYNCCLHALALGSLWQTVPQLHNQ